MNIKRIMSKKRVILSVMTVVGLSMSATLLSMDSNFEINRIDREILELERRLGMDNCFLKQLEKEGDILDSKVESVRSKVESLGLEIPEEKQERSEKELELKRNQEFKQYAEILKAIKMSEIDKIKFFVENNVDILNKHDEKGNTLLLKACIYSDFKIVEYLLPYCSKKVINKVGSFNMTPLLKACQFGDFNIIRLLIRNGATISEKKINTYEQKMVKYLKGELSKQSSLSLEKDGDILDSKRESLGLEISEEKQERCEKEKPKIKLFSKIYDEMKKKDYSEIKRLIESDVNIVNECDENGDTLLLKACFSFNDYKVVELLLNYCTKETINKVHENSGKTLLDWAVYHANARIIRLLFYNVRLKKEDYKKLIIVACKIGTIEFLGFLIKNNIVNFMNEDDINWLSGLFLDPKSLENGTCNIEIARLLFENGIIIGGKNTKAMRFMASIIESDIILYYDEILKYNKQSKKEKINGILNIKGKKIQSFLIRVAFAKAMRECKSFKELMESVFFKLYEIASIDLKEIFGVDKKKDVFEFINEVSSKNYFYINDCILKKKDIFYSLNDKRKDKASYSDVIINTEM